MNESVLIYDLEISKAIDNGKVPRVIGVNYCGGWNDHESMGISVIGSYDVLEGRFRIFCSDNLREFESLAADRKVLVGFNNLSFDNRVLRANSIQIDDSKSYDLMLELAAAAGNARWSKLDDVCQLNFGPAYAKKITGDMAPVLWQRGEIGKVIDYCLDDIRRQTRLFEQAMTGQVKCVKTGRMLTLRKPEIK